MNKEKELTLDVFRKAVKDLEDKRKSLTVDVKTIHFLKQLDKWRPHG